MQFVSAKEGEDKMICQNIIVIEGQRVVKSSLSKEQEHILDMLIQASTTENGKVVKRIQDSQGASIPSGMVSGGQAVNVNKMLSNSNVQETKAGQPVNFTTKNSTEREFEAGEATVQTQENHQEKYHGEEEDDRDDYENELSYQDFFLFKPEGQRSNTMRTQATYQRAQGKNPQTHAPTSAQSIFQKIPKMRKLEHFVSLDTNYVLNLEMLNKLKFYKIDFDSSNLSVVVNQLQSLVNKRMKVNERYDDATNYFYKKSEECYYDMLVEFFLEPRRRAWSRDASIITLFEIFYQAFERNSKGWDKLKKEIDDLEKLIQSIKLHITQNNL